MYVYSAELLKQPELLDHVEDPYVVVEETIDQSFSSLLKTGPNRHENIMSVMTMMHASGWETINVTFIEHRMVALLKNPRVKRSPEG